MVLKDEMYKDYTNFMNFLMIEIYAAIFQKRLPWVLLEMWDLLQAYTERRTRYWFPSEYGIVIRMCGFTQSPYMLLAFLTPRIFSMDFIRQKLFVEIEHFLKYKKSTHIKYHWSVGPLTIKNKGALKMVEGLLRDLGFQTEPAIKYDPHQVISNRRNAQKRKDYKQEEFVGLEEVSNWSNYPRRPQILLT